MRIRLTVSLILYCWIVTIYSRRDRGVAVCDQNLISGHIHVSESDQIYEIEDWSYLGTSKRNTHNRENIRIHIDNRYLQSDPKTCYDEGDSVEIGEPTSSVACKESGTSPILKDCYYTCTEDDVLSEEKKAVLEHVLERAVEWLEEALYVIPVSDNLILQTSDECGANGGVAVPSEYNSPGKANADVVLFLTTRPALGSVAAYAAFCQVDQHGRPIAGQINFSPSSISTEEDTVPSQIGVAVHEILHVLGFTGSKFSDFRDPANNFSVIPLDQVLKKENLPSGKGTREVTKIITPAVVQVAREHFGCETLDGVELEDGGGEGTEGSHWEKRLLNNEFMTGTSSSHPIYSKFTLALLADSGWYTVNWNMSEALPWGEGRGCDFVNEDCGEWTVEDGACFKEGHTACSYDYYSTAYCGMQTRAQDLPLIYQHFANPKIGGAHEASDYCPFYVPYAGGDCRFEVNADPRNLQAEDYTDDSRCFMSRVSKIDRNLNFPQDGGITAQGNAVCYPTVCTAADSLKVKVGEYWYDCGTEGESVNVVSDSWKGSFNCPSLKSICIGQQIDTNWPTFSGIEPKTGTSGTKVLVTGAKFEQGLKLIIAGVEATDIEFIGPTNFTAVVGDYSVLSLFDGSKKYVVIMNPNGRTHVVHEAFTVELSLADVWSQVWEFIKENYIWIAIVGGVLLCCCCSFIIWKCCRKKRSKVYPQN